jgi:hypothetical protein
MVLEVQKKKYNCTNFGSCSKASSQEIIELLPNEKPVCPEDGYPLTALEEEKTVIERALGWVKGRPALVAIAVAVVLLVPGAFVGYRFYQDRPIDVPPAKVPGSPPKVPEVGPPAGAGAQGMRYSDQTIADGERDAVAKLKGPGGGPAISAAQIAAARQLVNSAVGFMQTGHLDRADEQLGKALAENPTDTLAYVNRAIIRARQKRSEEALVNVDHALKNGFTNMALLERDADFGVVRSLPGYRGVLAKNGVKP